MTAFKYAVKKTPELLSGAKVQEELFYTSTQ
jgi:hypothetical protein